MRWLLWCFCLLAESYETINHYITLHYITRRAVFSQPEVGDQIWIWCRQYRQSTSKSIVKLNHKIQYPRKWGSEKQWRSYFLRFFFKNSSSNYQKRFAIGGYTTMFFVANVWFLSFRAVPKTAPKSPNSSASMLKTLSHNRHRWKWAKHCFFGFLGNVESKWCRKYRKWLCCEIFVTKSKLKASLAFWQNILP